MPNTNPMSASEKVIKGQFPKTAESQARTHVGGESRVEPSRESHADKKPCELSVLDQLNANLYQLEGLHHRLGFMVKELSSVLKVRAK